MAGVTAATSAANVAGGAPGSVEPVQGQLKAGAAALVAPKPVAQLSLTDKILGPLARYRVSLWSVNGIGLALIAGVALLLAKKFNPLVGRVLLLVAVAGILAQAWRSYAYRAGIHSRALETMGNSGQDKADAELVAERKWLIEIANARSTKNESLVRYLRSIASPHLLLRDQVAEVIPTKAKPQ